jgi:hypothetical protein
MSDNAVRLAEGEKLNRKPNQPIISLGRVGDDLPYLWIGNDADGDKFCYATLSGRKSLEKLARDILAKLEKSDVR